MKSCVYIVLMLCAGLAWGAEEEYELVPPGAKTPYVFASKPKEFTARRPVVRVRRGRRGALRESPRVRP